MTAVGRSRAGRPCPTAFTARHFSRTSPASRFGGIDYDDDAAPARLDAFVRHVQRIFAAYGGNLVHLSVGDKGAYLYGVFGSPQAHEDDAARCRLAQVPDDCLRNLRPDTWRRRRGRTHCRMTIGGRTGVRLGSTSPNWDFHSNQKQVDSPPTLADKYIQKKGCLIQVVRCNSE